MKLKKTKKKTTPKKKKTTTKAKKKITRAKTTKKKKVVKKKVVKKKVQRKPADKKPKIAEPVPVVKPETKKVQSKVTVATTTPKRPAKYLNNRDLLAEVIKSKKNQKMSNELAKMLMLLVSRYAKKGSFVNYTYNDDMQSYAMLMICKTWQGFDPAKSSNPFAWFTQCVKNSFIQYLNYEQRQRDIKDEVLIDNGMNPSFGYAYDLSEQQKQSSVDPIEHEVVEAPTKLLEDVDPFEDHPDNDDTSHSTY